MHFVRFLGSCSCISAAAAATHHLFAGNLYAPASIHVVEFNDETNTLTKIQTLAASAPHGWVQFDVRLEVSRPDFHSEELLIDTSAQENEHLRLFSGSTAYRELRSHEPDRHQIN